MGLPAQPNQSLIDGLLVLRALAMETTGVGSRELARQLGLDRTRTNRLLKTLAHLGLAEQTSNRQYRTGMGIHALAAQSMFGSALLNKSIGPLKKLCHPDRLVALGVRWNENVCYLLHAAPGQELISGIGSHGVFPAQDSSIGRVLLAYSLEEEVVQLESMGHLAKLGGLSEIKSRLSHIREVGYEYVDSNSNYLDMGSVAVPICDPPVASIAVGGKLSSPIDPKIVVELKQIAKEIELSLLV
jgi:DNA-binding IclR family transcriptional regulator